MLTTHRVLRTQAEARGTTLPQLSKDSAMTHVYDRISAILSLADSVAEDSVVDVAIWTATLQVEEPGLLAGLEAAGGISQNRWFVDGSREVYLAIKAAEEINKLNRLFD